MIPARKSKLFTAWFSRHAEKRIAKTFQQVRVADVEHLRAALDRPVILVSNHTSWWDPLICLLVAERMVDCDPYAMMDADNLRKLPFFARVGAFGVERGEQGQGLARDSIDYAIQLLDRPGRFVWIFAQGDERPINERPLGFRRGAPVVWDAVPDAVVIPLAIRYVFGHTEKPFLYLSFGPPVAPVEGVEPRRLALEAAVLTQLERIETALSDKATRAMFEVTHRAPKSWLGAFAERMLAWMNRKGALPRESDAQGD
ncbi:MAG: 1-acyl-sn-glycerol-3-phosphate acyltransferase [Bradymonadia bacterium]|jgi:1-acyl-sn-glycerol-3-phosphate acyltransferase